MTTLMHAHREWANRPADERFVSLPDLLAHCEALRSNSEAIALSSRQIEARPDGVNGLIIDGLTDHGYEPTHWAFGQLASLAKAPPSYLRTLPAPLAADNLNYGLKFARDVEDVGVLVTRNGKAELRAATGVNYGRVWNATVAHALIDRFGDGVTGQWKVPGEFGKAIIVTKDNTTFYAGDRDMFVFLADEQNRIEVPNRRHGSMGSMARGFFVWNSEVGSSSLGAAFFLYDYVCGNRIVWGAEQFSEIRIRHSIGAPDRWLEQIQPVLAEYRDASEKPIMQAIEDARNKRIEVDVLDFLGKRFNKTMAAEIVSAHERDEGRPIETVWDAVTGITAFARTVENQDRRITLERKAGDLMAA